MTHSSLRVYLRQEIQNLFWLIKDSPGLIAPKLPVLSLKQIMLTYFH